MVEVRYQPAHREDAWRIAVAGQVLAALPPAVSAQTAESIWRRLADGGIGALLEALTGAFGTSLTAIPPFALVVVEDDGVRVAVRGALEVVVEAESGPVAIASGGAATWAERVVPRAQVVTIELTGGIDPVDALPLAAGIVPAHAVTLRAVAPTHAGAPRRTSAASASTIGAGGTAPTAVSEATPDGAASATTAATAAAPTEAEPGDVGEATPHDAPQVAPQVAPEVAPEVAPVVAPEVAPEPAPEDANGLAPSEVLETVVTDRTRAKTSAGDAGQPPARSAGAEPEGSETWIPGATDRDLVSVPPMPPLPPLPPAPPVDWLVQGDHDGATISVAEARAQRAAAQTGGPGAAARPEVPIFEPLADVPVRQPAQGRIRLSTGRVVELERPVVIGRRPRSTRSSGEDLPTLIAVESPEHDISRSHVEIRAEGEHVLVTDLNTTNGTVLLRGGADPVRLHPAEPTMVVSGDVLDIGDGVTVTFEDLP